LRSARTGGARCVSRGRASYPAIPRAAPRQCSTHGATDALRKRGYDPDEPRIPEHHTGGGEWTRDSVAAADNVNVRPGEPLPIPIPAGWDKPLEHKPPEYESPWRDLFTDFYQLSIRQPIRDLGELLAHPEDIPNAIGSVAPGVPIAEISVPLAEFLTYISALRAGAAAGTTLAQGPGLSPQSVRSELARTTIWLEN
jgi:hypothetical protein